MKRFISFILVTTLLLGICNFAYAENGNWYDEAMVFVADWGFMQGDASGNMFPENNVTRAEIATIINRVTNSNKYNKSFTFADVFSYDWYEPQINYAAAAGLFLGSDGGNFYPLNFITRQEVAAVLGRAFPFDKNGEMNFTDMAEIADWALSDMENFSTNGYLNGFDGKINPNDYMTRAEIAQILKNIVGNYVRIPGKIENEEYKGNLVVTNVCELNNVTVDGNIYFLQGVGKGETKLVNVNAKNVYYIGADNGSISLENVNCDRVFAKGINGTNMLVFGGGEIGEVNVDKYTNLVVNTTGTIGSVNVNADANVEGTVANMTLKADVNVTSDKGLKIAGLTVEEEADGSVFKGIVSADNVDAQGGVTIGSVKIAKGTLKGNVSSDSVKNDNGIIYSYSGANGEGGLILSSPTTNQGTGGITPDTPDDPEEPENQNVITVASAGKYPIAVTYKSTNSFQENRGDVLENLPHITVSCGESSDTIWKPVKNGSEFENGFTEILYLNLQAGENEITIEPSSSFKGSVESIALFDNKNVQYIRPMKENPNLYAGNDPTYGTTASDNGPYLVHYYAPWAGVYNLDAYGQSYGGYITRYVSYAGELSEVDDATALSTTWTCSDTDTAAEFGDWEWNVSSKTGTGKITFVKGWNTIKVDMANVKEANLPEGLTTAGTQSGNVAKVTMIKITPDSSSKLEDNEYLIKAPSAGEYPIAVTYKSATPRNTANSGITITTPASTKNTATIVQTVTGNQEFTEVVYLNLNAGQNIVSYTKGSAFVGSVLNVALFDNTKEQNIRPIMLDGLESGAGNGDIYGPVRIWKQGEKYLIKYFAPSDGEYSLDTFAQVVQNRVIRYVAYEGDLDDVSAETPISATWTHHGTSGTAPQYYCSWMWNDVAGNASSGKITLAEGWNTIVIDAIKQVPDKNTETVYTKDQITGWSTTNDTNNLIKISVIKITPPSSN